MSLMSAIKALWPFKKKKTPAKIAPDRTISNVFMSPTNETIEIKQEPPLRPILQAKVEMVNNLSAAESAATSNNVL